MKLKYLFLAMLATAGFISCSNEDDKVDPNATYDAEINVAVSPSTEVSTKASVADASTNGTTGEQLVSRLTAFVFDASDKVVGVSDTTNTLNPTVNIDRIKRIVVKATESGTTYKLFIVANLHLNDAALLSKSTLTEIQNATTTSLEDETESSLTMSSKVLSITVKGKKDIRVYPNYLMNTDGTSILWGDENKASFESLNVENNVKLVRLVARVQLESLGVAFVGGNLENASFRLDSAYLVNVKSSSKFVGDDLTTGSAYWNGTGNFTVIDKLIVNGGIQKGAPFVVKPKIILKSGNSTNNPYDFTVTSNSANFLKAYIYENHIVEVSGTYNTRLVLKGLITLENGQSLGETYYHITIKDVADADYVLRNTIYKVSVTITGTGSPNEDQKSDLNAGINAKVTVSPWKVVNQTENDAN